VENLRYGTVKENAGDRVRHAAERKHAGGKTA